MENIVKPKEFDNMQPYLPSNINERVKEVIKEIEELRILKSSNRLTDEDVEDISDNYQYNLEWNYAMSELRDELECLRYQQWLDLKNESQLNALENQSLEC